MYESLQKTLTKILSRFANIKIHDREEEEERVRVAELHPNEIR